MAVEYISLSHPLDVKDPGFPGEPTLSIDNCTKIENGDPYNSYKLHLFNHFGTHVDAPRHFNPNGATISELPITDFVYEKPLLIDVPKGRASLVEPADLEPFKEQIQQADCLLIRTGLQKLREEDTHAYAHEGGAVSIDCAQWLMDNCSNLKAIGFDFISLASPANPEHGVKAHQILLGMYGGGYICIIEDMKLAHVPKDRLFKLIAAPLVVTGVDSGQVSCIAELH